MSRYLTSNDDVQTFKEKFKEIEDKVRRVGENFVIGGDFNELLSRVRILQNPEVGKGKIWLQG